MIWLLPVNIQCLWMVDLQTQPSHGEWRRVIHHSQSLNTASGKLKISSYGLYKPVSSPKICFSSTFSFRLLPTSMSNISVRVLLILRQSPLFSSQCVKSLRSAFLLPTSLLSTLLLHIALSLVVLSLVVTSPLSDRIYLFSKI